MAFGVSYRVVGGAGHSSRVGQYSRSHIAAQVAGCMACQASDMDVSIHWGVLFVVFSPTWGL